MKKIIIGATAAFLLSTNVFAMNGEEAEAYRMLYNEYWENTKASAQSLVESEYKKYNNSLDATESPRVAGVCKNYTKSRILNSVNYSNYLKEGIQYNNVGVKFRKPIGQKAWLEVFAPACRTYISNYVGSEINFSLHDSSGVSSSFTATQYCNNYSSYLTHLKSSNDDLKIAFYTFISRLPTNKLHIVEKISESKTEVQAHAVLTNLARDDSYRYERSLSINPFGFINIYMNNNNKSSKNGIGGNDLELKQFLAAVISKNFSKADSILERHIKESKKIVKKADWICNDTDIYSNWK